MMGNQASATQLLIAIGRGLAVPPEATVETLMLTATVGDALTTDSFY